MSKYKVELKWAVMFIVSMLLWMALEKISGLHNEHIDKHATFTNFFAIVAISIYLLALWDKRKVSYQDAMTWKQGFTSGLIISVIVAILSPIGQLITHYAISPDFFTNISAESVRQGMMTQEEASNYFNMQSYIIQSSAGALIMGLVTSAVVSLIIVNIKKSPKEDTERLGS